jgi:hypothetical protein
MADENIDPITIQELKEEMKSNKEREAPDCDGINIELIKYAGPTLHCGL